MLMAMCLMCVCTGWAEKLTPDQALARLNKTSLMRAPGSKRAAPMKLVAEMPQVYVFSSGSGYAIVPADDCAPALLGYADEGTFDLKENPSLAWWMNEYSRMIKYASAKKRPLRRLTPVSGREPIKPMCPTFWNQGAPFNDSCPLLNGKRCVTGCVATAMSILMRYHQYPVQGVGEHSYKWHDTTLTFNYGATKFQWDQMPERYDAKSTPEQRAAVAQLMYAAGVGVGMFFHPGESAAYINNIEPALRKYFNYSRSMWTPARNYYDLEQWNDLIYGELAAGRPVIYFGDGSDGGHEFICDGYSEDGYFHINWGWGGISNGYFTFIDLDPPALGIGGGDGGFNFQQGAILGVQPPQEGDTPHYIMYCPAGFVAEKTSVGIDDDLTFRGRYFNRSSIKFPDGAAYGIQVQPLNGDSAITIVSADLSGMESNHSENGMNVKMSTLPVGSYRISPVFKAAGDWERIPTPVNSNTSYVAEVTPDSVFLTDPGVPKLSGGKIDMKTPLVWKRNFMCNLEVYNNGAGAFSGTIRPQLLTMDSLKVVANGAELVIAVPANDSVNAHFDGRLTLNSHYSTTEPAAGQYVLKFINSGSHQQIGDTLHITLHEPSDTLAYTVEDLMLVNGSPVVNLYDAHFTATVNCTSGYFAQQVQIVIYRKEGRRDVQQRAAKSSTLYIVGGETGNVNVKFDLSKLEPGNYQARAFVNHKAETDFLDFTIDSETSVSDAVNDATPGRMYDLWGRPLKSPRPGEIYISNGEKFLSR